MAAERIVNAVLNHDFKKKTFIVTAWAKADAVRAANALRGMGYSVKVNEFAFIFSLEVQRGIKNLKK